MTTLQPPRPPRPVGPRPAPSRPAAPTPAAPLPAVSATPPPPAPRPTRVGNAGLLDDRRLYLVVAIALALAVLGTGGFAVYLLIADVGGSAFTASAPAGSPAVVSTGPVVTDSTGRALPTDVEREVRSIYALLEAGNVEALQASYAPDRSTGSAAWPAVAELLRTPEDRDGLLAALRTSPVRRPEVAFYYARDGFRVGLNSVGRIAFLRAP